SRQCMFSAADSQLALQSHFALARAEVGLTGSQVWRIGFPNADGTRDVRSLPSDSHFDCVTASILSVQAAACLRMDPAGEGHGVIDCTGGQAAGGYNAMASVDHNTSENSTGFAFDFPCDDVYRNPNNDPGGTLVTSFREGGQPNHPHSGVCNSGEHLDRSGAFAAAGL